jgi:allantoin racemase
MGGQTVTHPAATRIWYQSFTDPVDDEPYFTRLGNYLRSVSRAESELQVRGIRPSDHFLHPITEFRCAAQVIANAITAEREGYDAFVIGHFQDAGLFEARATVEIPVIGLGEASMLNACTLGRKIGLVTINPVFIPYLEDQVARYGLERRVIEVRAVAAQVDRLNRAFGDEREFRLLRDEFIRQAEPMLDLGIDVIILAGGYPMLLFATEQGFTINGAMVVNGLPVAVAAAETAVTMRRLNGTCTSRAGTYALPPQEAVAEFGRAFRSTAAPEAGSPRTI